MSAPLKRATPEGSPCAKRQSTACPEQSRGAQQDTPHATRLHLQHPVLRLRQSLEESGCDLTFRFQNTPSSATRRVDTISDLHTLLCAETRRAEITMDSWVRQPKARWIDEMIRELNPARREHLASRHRQLQAVSVPEDSLLERWAGTSDFASHVLSLWFEDKSLSDVLARSAKLGHTEMGSGYILTGALVENRGNLTTDFTAASDVGMDWIKPAVEKMCHRTGSVSVFKVCAHNCFHQEQEQMTPVEKIEECEGQGSLNTTWTYPPKPGGNDSKVELMDSFHRVVHETLDSCDAVQLNRRLYMIWKSQHYVTSYHQDTHVPPHFTIYNQVSGVSLFHFLPLLVGLYVTHIGRQSASKLDEILKQIDGMGIGSIATLGPGQVALILPFGAHGVWVPSATLNPEMPPFRVSLIRAAELFVRPILEYYQERLRSLGWNSILHPTANELAQLSAFTRAQLDLCREMGLSKADWLWLVRQMWVEWERAVDSDSEGDQTDSDNHMSDHDSSCLAATGSVASEGR